MALPIVAVVGRPNVGKSTLFNRLVGEKKSIVENVPGVTRDRIYAEAEWYGRRYLCVDTGGFDPTAKEGMLPLMADQVRVALEEASAIVVLLDAQAGLTPADIDVVRLLRRSATPTFFAANKVDGPGHETLAAEFYGIGADVIYPLSAEHGRGLDDLMTAVFARIPEPDVLPAASSPEGRTRIAVVGRPNVGK